MFKESFKYYKSKKLSPNLEEVFDFHNEKYDVNKVKKIGVDITYEQNGLNNSKNWEVYEFIDRPGLIYIKNPFSPFGQRYWTVKCLKEYSKKNYKTNLDQFNIISDNEEWWEVAQNNKDILKKLRWATLGYHHDWDNKVYTEDNKGTFPSELNIMTKTIAYSLGYSNFNSEAAIVNYYHMDSTLSGHTDHSEPNLEAPLFSFSFGQTAIFLIGGSTIDEKPMAIYLKSGDIVVMSRESRLAYHGVPKIIRTSEPTWNIINNNDNNNFGDLEKIEDTIYCTNEKLWEPFEQYLEHSRININVRQVLNNNQKNLNVI